MTNSRRTAVTALRWSARALALTAAYFVVAKIGLRYATIGPSISPVWPPTGLAVAALALLGPRYWPAILLGAFLANATTSIPVLAAAGLACGNATEATVAAYLLRRRAGQHLALDDLLGVRTLVGVAAPVGALASAAVGVTSLWLAHVVSGAAVWSALSLWWAGDYLGALVVAPVFLTWLGPAGLRIGRRTALELALLVGGAVLATMAIFGSLLPASLLPQAEYPYLLFPFVIGAALRFGPRGAALLTLTVATLAVGYTVRGGGPFVMQTVPSTTTALMLYVGILAITGLSLGPATARHERAERALRDANEHLAAVIQSSPLAIYTLDPTSTVRTWNRAAEALYGCQAEEVLGRRHRARFQQSADRDYRNDVPGAGGYGARVTGPPGHPRNREGRQAGCRAHASAADLQPAASARAPRARPERAGRQPGEDVASAHRRGHRAADEAGRPAGGGASRSGPAGTGDREPGGECPGRHAARRPPHDRDGGCRARSGLRRRARANPAGAVRAARHQRHGCGHGWRDQGAPVRAVFHDQRARAGYGTRARDGLRYRQAERRGQLEGQAGGGRGAPPQPHAPTGRDARRRRNAQPAHHPP